MTLDPSKALGNLPPGLRDELVTEFQKITRNYRERRWEAAELDGGRFSEIVYSIVAGFLDGGNYPATASKPKRFDDACKKLENAPLTYPDSARLTIPRVLLGLYDVRNRRGVGHVGGDVDANHMDATFVLHAAQWVMAELVRIFHSTDTTMATATVDALVDRTIPLVWHVGDVHRVLAPNMSLPDKTLVLAYSEIGGVTDKSLMASLEQMHVTNYRSRVLAPLHKEMLVDYNRTTGLVTISPLGEQEVEERLLKTLAP